MTFDCWLCLEWWNPSSCCCLVWTHESDEALNVLWCRHKAQKQGGKNYRNSFQPKSNTINVTQEESLFNLMSKAHTCTYFLSILGGKNCRGTCSRCWIWLHCQIYQQLPNQSRQEKPHYSSLMFQLIKEFDNNPHRLPAKQAFCLSVILPRSHTYHQVFHNYANLDFFLWIWTTYMYI